MTEYRWTITFHSDWGVGAGHSLPGGVDDTVRLDRDGLPFLPGKTATGLWRDAVEQAVTALSRGADREQLLTWTEVLLGPETHHPASRDGVPRARPHAAALAVRGAHVRRPLARHLARRPALAGTLRGLVPGVRLCRDTGTAVANMLRFEERARAGLTLHGTIELDPRVTAGWNDAQIGYTEAIVVVAASLFHHAGGDRRRGAGRCTVELPDAMPLADAAGALREVVDPPSPLALVSALPADARRAADGVLATFELTLTCRLPVVATRRALGNIYRSTDHIPGSYMIAEVAGRLKAAGLDADDAIRRGRLCVTDATSEVGGARGLPVPRCLAAPKGEDRLSGATNLFRDTQPGDKPIRRGYITTATGRTAHYRAVAVEAHTHNVIEDAKQRPTEAVGGVYSYQAIPAETVLRAEVVVPSEWAKTALGALHGAWRIGRASKDEYGRVDVDVAPAVHPERRFDPVEPRGELVVWLTSIALVRDHWLEPVTSEAGLRNEVARILRMPLEPPDDERPSAMLTVERRESWQRAWGLPRPTLVGIAAGSVLRSRAPQGVSVDALARLDAEGIGERRAEGFGRVEVNPRLLREPTISLTDQAADSRPDKAGTAGTPVDGVTDEIAEDEATLIVELERERLRAEIDQRAAALDPYQVLADGDRVAAEAVTRSQWGMLRDRVNRAAEATDRRRALGRVCKYLDDAAARRDAWKQSSVVRQKVDDLLTGDRVWRLLDLAGDRPTGVDGEVLGHRDEPEIFGYAVARTLGVALSRLRAQGSEEGS